MMMACMMVKDIANIKPYYVGRKIYSSLMKEDKQETECIKQILPMPEYKIELPNEKLIKCLDIISRKGNITKRELKDSAIEAGLIHVDEKRITAMRRTKEEYSDQAAYMSLNKNLIGPLRGWRFITESKVATHHIVSITEDGKRALKFLSADLCCFIRIRIDCVDH